MLKKWILEGILWVIVVITGLLIDVFLSYNIYLKDPERFISYESNREFVDFLTTGSIPVGLITGVLCVIFLSAYCFYRIRVLSGKARLFCRGVLWFLACIYLIAHCSAGSSWYVGFYHDVKGFLYYCFIVSAVAVACIDLFFILGGWSEEK